MYLYVPFSHLEPEQRAVERVLRVALGGVPVLNGHVWPVEAEDVGEACAELRVRGVPLAISIENATPPGTTLLRSLPDGGGAQQGPESQEDADCRRADHEHQ